MKGILKNIRIILIETSHAGNIGSVARAMKTMGLTNFWLVNPLAKINLNTIALAAGANDIINNVNIVDSFDKALEECSLVIGTSARSRKFSWPMLTPKECGVKSILEAKNSPVALVFGRERIGLTNEELEKCHYHLVIDANPEYNSLNLAMAVQIISYEIWTTWLTSYSNNKKFKQKQLLYPTIKNLEYFYITLERVLKKVGFIHVNKQGKIMSKLRRLFTRARLEIHELNILHGILSSIEKLKKNG